MTRSLPLLKNTYSTNKSIVEIISDFHDFKREADEILSVYESSKTRTIKIQETYIKLSYLNIRQRELIAESLRCVENGLFRASHILSWSAFIDYLGEKFLEIHYPDKDRTWLREKFSDHSIIEQLQSKGMCSKDEKKSILGLLAVRNECAHPTDFFPDLNESLGYVSAIISRMEMFNYRDNGSEQSTKN